jgi:hypothetical protein
MPGHESEAVQSNADDRESGLRFVWSPPKYRKSPQRIGMHPDLASQADFEADVNFVTYCYLSL